MKKRITVERLPIHVLSFGVLLIVLGLFGILASNNLYINILFLIVGALMVGSRQMVVIDTRKKTYSEFYSILGMHLKNTTEEYEVLGPIILMAGEYTQEYGKYNRRFIRGTMYKAYLVISEDDSVFIGQGKNYNRMSKKVNRLAGEMAIEVDDRSGEGEY